MLVHFSTAGGSLKIGRWFGLVLLPTEQNGVLRQENTSSVANSPMSRPKTIKQLGRAAENCGLNCGPNENLNESL